MVEEIKNIIFAGIGSAALTYEKASEIIDTLVKKGQLTVDQGKDLAEELKRNIKTDNVECTQENKSITLEDVYELLKKTNLDTIQEIQRLEDRIKELEDKINK